MNQPPPTITVYAGGWHRTFGPGGDVVIGRDVQADVRLPQPGVSRAHVLLRYVDGHWIAVDNASTKGMFVEQRRVSSVNIRDGQTIHIGEPDGPPVTFALGSDDIPPDDRNTIPTRRDGDGKTEAINLVTSLIRTLRQALPAEPPTGSVTIGREVDND